MHRVVLLLALIAFSASPLFAHAAAWQARTAGTLSQTADNTAASAPASVAVGDAVFLVTIVNANGTARTLSTPAGWTLVDDILSGNASANGKVFCRIWQMGDSIPTLDWSGSGNQVMMQALDFFGPTAPDCPTMVDASTAGTVASGASWPSDSLTIPTANDLIIEIGVKFQPASPSAMSTISCPTDVSTQVGVRSNASAFEINESNCYRIETTATNLTGPGFTVSGTFPNSISARATVALKQQDTLVPPTFTANPDIGTRTTSSIPITATSACTDCTLYVVAVTDGSGAPTAAQIKAGQNSSGSAAYKSCSAAMTSTVQATCTLSSYTDGTVRDGYAVMESTANSFSSVYGSGTLVDMSKLPAFTTALTIASTSTSAFTSNSKLLDGPGTVTWVRCKYGATPPTVAQVEAHTGGCITDYATDDASGTMALTVAGGQPDGDLFYVGQYSFGSQHEASVHTLSGQCLSPGTGFQLINCPAGLTSLGTGSPPKLYNDKTIVTITYGSQTANFTLGALVLGGTSGAYGTILLDSDAGVTGQLTLDTLSGTLQNGESLADNFGGAATSTGAPSNYTDIATGDILQVPTTVQPSGAALTVGADGQYSYSAAGRQTALNGTIFDASAETYLTVKLDFVSTNAAPSCGAPPSLVLTTNIAMTPLNLNSGCSDADNDAITWARISGAIPAGLSFDAATGILSGTPTVQDLVGVTLTFLGYDGYGGIVTQTVSIIVATNFTLPDCVSVPILASACAGGIIGASSGSVHVTSTYVCNATVAPDYVISQNPAGGATVVPGDTEALSVSLGTANAACVAHVKTVSCLRKTLDQCEAIYFASPFDGALSVVGTASCPSSAYQHDDLIYAQTPAPGAIVNAFSTVNVSYCPSP